jgi:hypothetical protein
MSSTPHQHLFNLVKGLHASCSVVFVTCYNRPKHCNPDAIHSHTNASHLSISLHQEVEPLLQAAPYCIEKFPFPVILQKWKASAAAAAAAAAAVLRPSKLTCQTAVSCPHNLSSAFNELLLLLNLLQQRQLKPQGLRLSSSSSSGWQWLLLLQLLLQQFTECHQEAQVALSRNKQEAPPN